VVRRTFLRCKRGHDFAGCRRFDQLTLAIAARFHVGEPPRFDGHPPRDPQGPERMSQYGDDGEERPRPRRSFTPEFKVDIVERRLADDRSVTQVAEDFDLTVSAVRGWVKQHEIDAGTREGLTTDEKEELSRLRRENWRLREEVEILKRATVFFAKETR
jgi:transposase